MAMTASGQRTVCLVGFFVYLVALGLLLAGFTTAYWVDMDVRQNNVGLWKACRHLRHVEEKCETIALDEMPEFFQSVVALMIIGLLFAIIGGATIVFLAVTSAMQSMAGVLILVATCLFATKLEHTDSAEYISWSFILAALSGVVFVLNGIGLGLASYKAGCEPKPVPCPCWVNPKKEEWKWRVYDL